jgi:nucleotide-binding universal stress UspA family protein
MYKKILIGVDGSEDAHKALNKVIDFYQKWNCEIVTFHSIKHHMVPYVFPIFSASYNMPSASTIREEYIKLGNKILEETKMIFKKEEIPVETRLVEDIEPEKYIIDKVKEENFDLVVLGSKGHHSKIHILLGRVSSHVVNNVVCDVLIIR